MTENERERETETKRLERVLDEVLGQLAEARATETEYESSVRETRRMLWQEGKRSIASFDDIIELKQQEELAAQQSAAQALYAREVRQLKKMASTPYFGRIDFRDDGAGGPAAQPERIYIGISSLVDRTSREHLVYDWRAPISSLFYDAEPGPAGYDCDAGRVSGEVTLKRQYKIEDGRLLYFFDTSVTIEDEMLQEILSKSADTRMRNIVTTIQREQNRIIRDETHPLLVVQGPAGSGKTSVALHRIAYLLYHHRNEMSAANIVIVSPNPIFSSYVAGVLPELGEENMLQTTFQEYAHMRLGSLFELEDLYEQMEFLLSSRGKPGYDDRVQSVRFKSSLKFFGILKRYLERIESGYGIAFADAVHNGRVVASADELKRYFSDNAFLPVAQRLEKVKNRVAYLVEPELNALREEIEAELKTRPEYSSNAEIRWEARTRAQAVFAPLHEKVAEWAAIDPVECYAGLFRDERLFAELAGETLPEGFGAMCEQTLSRMEEGRLGYEDIAPLLFLQNVLEGPPKKNEIRHVVVDEAQDYTPCHYAVLRQVFPRARFTVLGDLNQSIHPYAHLNRYEDVLDVFDTARGVLVQMGKSYRSTREIVDFTKALLPEGELIEATLRSGPRPRVVRVRDEAERARAIAQDVARLKAEGMRSVALICKTAAEADRLYELVGGETEARRVTNDDVDLPGGVVVIPASLAKGLEFDAVIIPDASAGAYGHADELKVLYTACTRALHRLRLFVVGPLSPLIERIDKALYEEDVPGNPVCAGRS